VRISGLAVPAANSVRSASGHYRPVRKPPLTAATAQMCNLPDPLWGSRASALTAGSQPTRCPSPNTAKPTSDVRHRPQPAPGVPAQPPCQKARHNPARVPDHHPTSPKAASVSCRVTGPVSQAIIRLCPKCVSPAERFSLRRCRAGSKRSRTVTVTASVIVSPVSRARLRASASASAVSTLFASVGLTVWIRFLASGPDEMFPGRGRPWRSRQAELGPGRQNRAGLAE
jgi:hypothetical protein